MKLKLAATFARSLNGVFTRSIRTQIDADCFFLLCQESETESGSELDSRKEKRRKKERVREQLHRCRHSMTVLCHETTQLSFDDPPSQTAGSFARGKCLPEGTFELRDVIKV